MSTTSQEPPPPIPPRPSSSESSGQEVSSSSDIHQLLSLIDSELAVSYPNSSHSNGNQAPSPLLSSKQTDPASPILSTTEPYLSTNSPYSSHSPVPQWSPNQSYIGYDPQSASSTALTQPYNPSTPGYTALPYQYHSQNYLPYHYNPQNCQSTYYPKYPQDLTTPGWPPGSRNNAANGTLRPLPLPPNSNSSHVYNNPYPIYTSHSNVNPPQFNLPQKIQMPDFNTYVGPPTLSDESHNAFTFAIHPSDQSTTHPYEAYPAGNTNLPASLDPRTLLPTGFSDGSTTSFISPTKEPINYPQVQSSSSSKMPLPHSLNGFVDPSLLSNIALAFQATVKLGTHLKGALEYPESFTGSDAVSTIESLLPPLTNRRIALHMARSLEAQLYFHSVNWSKVTVVRDDDDEVYTFLNTNPASQTAWECDEDFPTGVFPNIAKCYSPRCGFDRRGCYSRTCINYVPSEEESQSETSLKRHSSVLSISRSEISDTQTLVAQTQDGTWIGSVPKEVSDKLDKEERKRQEIIFETIYTEEDYNKDLDLLEELYVEGLRKANPPIIPPSRLEQFIQDVFYNVFQIRAHNRLMLELLRERQKEGPVVEKIGDIFLESSLNFGKDYILYNGHFPLADNFIKSEKMRNPQFKSFLEECTRNPKARRLDFRHFAQRPTTRLQRYTLLLEQIIKHTSDENPDKEILETANQTIKELCRESDTKVHEAEKRLRIVELDQKLHKKNGEPCSELRLLDPNRSLIFKGELKKKPEYGLEWLDLHVFLFDNYFVMTKQRKGNDGEIKYQVSKKMIPMELLKVDNSPEQPQKKTFNHIPFDPRRGRSNIHSQPEIPPPLVTDLDTPENLLHQKSLFPFTVIHLGKNGGSFQLFADSANTRKLWKDKIIEAQTKFQLSKSHQQVFELFTLNDSTFGSSPVGNPANPTGALSPPSAWKGKVNCSVPFVTPEKRNMVAIGTDEGIWMGFGGETKSFRNVLRINNVMQMAVLEEYAIFVVLADKMLLAYSLEVIIPSSTSPQVVGSHSSRQPLRLNANTNVQYFNVGTIKDRTFLVYMKKRGLDSTFKVLEPVVVVNNHERSRGFNLALGSRRLGLGKQEWFKEYKQFYIPSESYSINFLRSKLCVVCTRGFEIVNLDTLQPVTIPDFNSPQFVHVARRCENSKPLGMFRLADNEFLLCYDEMFFYVDNYGELSRQKLIDWEGKPTAVAMHSPYVIGFDPQFIEIRNVQTGELVQIIPGTNMQCLNDNGSGRHAIHGVMQHPFTDTSYIFQLVFAEMRRTTSIRGGG
ncbi:hypothetical protein G9A89_019273 [Geosiphon pyriformis]|nr:hypothetical protein G9A89_019273 [Geosiphon pyriformis]